jgi:phosphoribosylformimino-5-aminoimidazole carboxamide ribotide isomerase
MVMRIVQGCIGTTSMGCNFIRRSRRRLERGYYGILLKLFSEFMEIIPAIDIIEGKCVRLTQGDYGQKKVYNERPLEVALAFQDAGLKRLHLVDLDGAKAGEVRNWKVLETIAGKTELVDDFGGGIKTAADVEIVFNSGAALATVGSVAVKDGPLFVSWLAQYGAERFLLGADVKNEKIAVSGWLETTDRWVYDFIREYIEKGVRQVFCTDVSKDGLLQGPALELYKNIVAEFPELYFIASGGVSGMDDVRRLEEAGCKGVIIGKAIYEGRIALNELSKV